VFRISPQRPSATFVIPEEFDHTPSMLHTSLATVSIHKSYLQLTAQLVLSLMHVSAVNRSHFPATTSVANTLTLHYIPFM